MRGLKPSPFENHLELTSAQHAAASKRILLKAHSVGVQLKVQEFTLALGCHQSSVREKFGPQVSARESEPGDDDRE